MYKKIQEGCVKVYVPKEEKVSKDLPVFYNPVMEFNRTTAILILNALEKKEMQIALPLAGTGVRGIRFLKELNAGIIKNISFNDYSKEAVKLIKKNVLLNFKKQKYHIEIKNLDANDFLLGSAGFDYIDIDPFGSPNPFLDSAIKRISREGILAITATDTSALCGTHPDACKRKYWAIPKRNELMHEIGIRILIRKVQLIGAQYEKALIPIFSYSKDHYMRVLFTCIKGKKEVDKILEQHSYFEEAGPLWVGKLWHVKLLRKIKSEDKFFNIIKAEAEVEEHMKTIGFYYLPIIQSKNKISKIIKQEKIMEIIREKGYFVAKTHFDSEGIRSNISYEELLKILKE